MCGRQRCWGCAVWGASDIREEASNIGTGELSAHLWQAEHSLLWLGIVHK